VKNEKTARRAADFRGPQRGERERCSNDAAATNDRALDAQTEDEEALRQARTWREEHVDAWCWLVGRLAQAQEAGRRYESLRRLTDELSQVHDFTDDDGGKVSVPHKRGLGRGLALLMLRECPQFRPLLRMREETRKETSDDMH
jgi:hypothetical protein